MLGIEIQLWSHEIAYRIIVSRSMCDPNNPSGAWQKKPEHLFYSKSRVAPTAFENHILLLCAIRRWSVVDIIVYLPTLTPEPLQIFYFQHRSALSWFHLSLSPPFHSTFWLPINNFPDLSIFFLLLIFSLLSSCFSFIHQYLTDIVLYLEALRNFFVHNFPLMLVKR